jgi:hypothetical protein
MDAVAVFGIFRKGHPQFKTRRTGKTGKDTHNSKEGKDGKGHPPLKGGKGHPPFGIF